MSQLGENYRGLYFGKKLGTQEIVVARVVVDDIRQATANLAKQWADFCRGRRHVESFWGILNSPKLMVEDVRRLMSDLTTISSVGSEALGHLDQVVVYTLHYQRQTTYLESDEANKMIQDDAIELQAWVDQASRQVRDDVAGAQAQIQLASLYSQTALTSQISLLTRNLVILTGVVIAVSFVAAVAGVITLAS